MSFFFGVLSFGWGAFLIYAAYSLLTVTKFNARGSKPQAQALLSILIAVKDDEAEIGQTLAELQKLTYSPLEIIVVVDRSTDRTQSIVEAIARIDKRVRTVVVTSLPAWWLGKVHALHVGAQTASGDFILLMDADMAITEAVLNEALRLVETQNLDHLSIVPRILSKGFWHDLMMCTSNILFLSSYRPWLSIDQRPLKCVKGMGKFNLIRRKTFERTEGFDWLKMDVADDVALSQLIAKNSGRSLLVKAGPQGPELSWYENFWGIVKGLEKNIVGGFTKYDPLFMVFMVSVASLPLLAFLLAMVLAPLWAGVFLVFTLLFSWRVRSDLGYPLGLILFFPLGLFLLAMILLRSSLICYRQGGILWSGTKYNLAELRKGARVKMGL